MAQADSSMLSRECYTVGWVCALPLELAASKMMLDQIHHHLPIDGGTNFYILGSILHHNVVMACLPIKKMGTIEAAVAAANMNRSFPSIRMCLVVGIGGGVPSKADVRLGDVVVGVRTMQYDEVKTTAGGQEPRTPQRTLGAILSTVSALYELEPNDSRFSSILQEKLANKKNSQFRPPNLEDRLFRADYEHISSEASCDRCDSARLVIRGHRKTNMVIHYGGIASGNQAMKHGRKRDEIAKDLDVICFDMEAAGVMDVMDCLVIRGICDYSDSHRTKEWQNHAAAAAAAYAKGFLEMVPKTEFQSKATNISRPPQHIPRERQQVELASLRFKRMSFREHTIKENHAQTCQWFLNDPIYQEWLDAALLSKHPGLIWVRGEPGAGKSTLIKFAWLQTQRKYQQACRDRKVIVASFFFNARGETLEKSVLGMYRSLLVQLLEHFDDLHIGLGSRELEGVLSLDSYPLGILKDLFRDAVSKLGNRAFIGFIDALDECHELQFMDMVRYFEELAEHATQKGIPLRICFSSRNYPYINIRGGLELRLEHQSGHAQDIANYVRSELQIEDTDLREELVSQILDKSAVLSILWILLAQRPLELEEFYHGCWHFKDPMFAKEYTSNRAEKYVLSSTKGLAQVVQSTPPTVQFIHESHAIDSSIFPALLDDYDLQDTLPLMRYATQHVLYHAENAAESIRQDEFLEEFPTAEWGFPNLIRTRVRKHPNIHIRGERHDYPLFAALANGNKDAVAALFNLPSTIYDGVDITKGLNSIKDMGLYFTCTPLSWAAEEGRAGLVKLLLLAQADVNERDQEGLTPLLRAESNCHWAVVSILIKAGADLNEFSYGNKIQETDVHPLMYAAAENDEVFAGLLIENGAYVGEIFEDEDFIDQTALTIASKHGHEEVASLLIENGAIVNDAMDDGLTGGPNPLVVAAENGHIHMVRLLIESGIDLDCGGPALLRAVQKGHDAIASLLISEGADINFWSLIIEPCGSSPLVVASENGHESLVRLLLSKGARIDPPCYYCRSALISALSNGQERIVELLVDKGADVNAEADKSTPLIAASKAGHEATARLLIDNGADVNTVTNRSSPLIAASKAGHEAIARLLIDNGADVNTVTNRSTPLAAASEAGHEAIVQLLINNGADVNHVGMSDYDSRTPLDIASSNGHEAVVRLLLEHGAEARSWRTLELPLR
ncbi:Pfs, NACHT and Ankyrin domain protein [Metarhizium acridum CQMa 102]|uniref:Pfs, NACHT and Ankyrin domain protein n=1 Tax=Metarhizium acridum (strain CQMa 102) TaxID=655827 RepID=E9EF34_METAQ|nr:Pfs, NACHT and Ankyrin domain protein [Metarhizium acridum CQMa 102]EFY85479.1 Pfs, NACHT and Ankyrin domain protein [Metarhizium acridum CQMa 102]